MKPSTGIKVISQIKDHDRIFLSPTNQRAAVNKVVPKTVQKIGSMETGGSR
jgi:hypothetical protein